jgi:hypothetical protein
MTRSADKNTSRCRQAADRVDLLPGAERRRARHLFVVRVEDIVETEASERALIVRRYGPLTGVPNADDSPAA